MKYSVILKLSWQVALLSTLYLVEGTLGLVENIFSMSGCHSLIL